MQSNYLLEKIEVPRTLKVKEDKTVELKYSSNLAELLTSSSIQYRTKIELKSSPT